MPDQISWRKGYFKKKKKCISTLGGTDNGRVTVLSYICKFLITHILVNLEKKVDGRIH